MIIMALSCNKYEKQTIEWLNMIVSQDPTILSVIVTAKDMIKKCLCCEQLKEWCSSTANFVRLLDGNPNNDKPNPTTKQIPE